MIEIGKFKEIYKSDECPSIRELITDTPFKYKETVIKYLKLGKIQVAAPGIINDIIDGNRINLTLAYMTDGEFCWRSDLVYYYEKYNIKLPDDFIKKVLINKIISFLRMITYYKKIYKK
jgi:hypothetical protein